MEFCCLASGSKGNAYYLKSCDTEVLIDNGLSLADIEKRLKSIGKSPSAIKAIFLTHEHTDHVSGVVAFCAKYGAKLFVHKRARQAIDFLAGKIANQIEVFDLADFYFEALTISPFLLSHDAAFPVGFSFYSMGKKVSILTDSGYVPEDVFESISGSDLVALESNYDLSMLITGPYPAKLKRRISGEEGHLANADAAVCAKRLADTGTKTIVLVHLSEKNNIEEIAFDCTKAALGDRKVELCVSNQYKPTKLFIV